MRIWPVAALLLAACSPGAGESTTAAAPPTAGATHPESGLPVIPLTVSHDGQSHGFRVEVARTSEEQAKGLMFRRAMGADEGMLFPFDPPRQASFWMKNTVISLDLLFIRADGSVESIAANAVPYSLDPISSGEPVAAVLEIAAGRAAELGIKPGDTVTWRDKR